jgi:hypothetical protein
VRLGVFYRTSFLRYALAGGGCCSDGKRRVWLDAWRALLGALDEEGL